MNNQIITKMYPLTEHTFKQEPLSFIDIFAGCGGLSLGLFKAGWQGLFAIEHDAFAFSTLNRNLVGPDAPYQFHWPEWLPKTPHSVHEFLGHYEKNLEALAGKVDMIVGGPPCQGFSSAGRRDPADPRNRLVEAYLRFVELIKPKLVLIENVKGITADFDDHDNPDYLNKKLNYAQQIIESLSQKYSVSAQVIDTSKFGVPQRRHRFFIIATRKDIAATCMTDPFEELFIGRERFLLEKGLQVPVASHTAISDLEITRNGKRISSDTAGFEEIAYRAPITAYQKLMHSNSENNVTDTRLARHKPEIIKRFIKIKEHCQASGRLNVSLSTEFKASLGLKKCAIRVLDPDSPSPTITSMPDDLLHYSEPRTLTVRENARLQSFPDWFKFEGKYTSGGHRRKREVPRFTQVANAVPPLAAEAIGQVLRERLKESKNTNLTILPKAVQLAPEILTAQA